MSLVCERRFEFDVERVFVESVEEFLNVVERVAPQANVTNVIFPYVAACPAVWRALNGAPWDFACRNFVRWLLNYRFAWPSYRFAKDVLSPPAGAEPWMAQQSFADLVCLANASFGFSLDAADQVDRQVEAIHSLRRYFAPQLGARQDWKDAGFANADAYWAARLEDVEAAGVAVECQVCCQNCAVRASYKANGCRKDVLRSVRRFLSELLPRQLPPETTEAAIKGAAKAAKAATEAATEATIEATTEATTEAAKSKIHNKMK